jgi:RNA recognition motif-containing protein
MKRLFVGGLSPSTTEADLIQLFEPYGRVRHTEVVSEWQTGQCRGFGFVEMEGHEARAAMTGLDGQSREGRTLQVREAKDDRRSAKRRRRR